MHGACTEHLEAQCFRDLQLYLTTESSSLAGQVGYALDGGFMSTNDIILTIDAEFSRLQQAKALLTDTFSLTRAKRKLGRPCHCIWERQSNQL